MNQPIKNWEEKTIEAIEDTLDNAYHANRLTVKLNFSDYGDIARLLLPVISSLLSEATREAVEKVEGMKKERFKWDYKEGEGEYKDGYNEAIDDVLNLLKDPFTNPKQ